ncbi:MAG: hypothetical protein ABI671_02945 [Burkholderiales bacterium]
MTVRLSVQLEQARLMSPDEALPRLDDIVELARSKEYLPIATFAAALRLDAWRVAGQLENLAREVDEVEVAARRHRAPHPYLPEMLLVCARAHAAVGRAQDAERCVGDGLQWIHVIAWPHVPEVYRAGFAQHNPVNTMLQAEAARRASAQGDSSTITGA